MTQQNDSTLNNIQPNDNAQYSIHQNDIQLNDKEQNNTEQTDN